MGNYKEFGTVGLHAASPPSQGYPELQMGTEANTTKTDPETEVPTGVAKEGFWRQYRYWVVGVVLVVVIGAIVGGAVGGVLSARGGTSPSPDPDMFGPATPGFGYSYPTPVSWGPQRLLVLGVSGSGAVRGAGTLDGNRIDSWAPSSSFENFGGYIHPNLHIAANCRKPSSIDVYTVGGDSALYHTWYNSTWNSTVWKFEGGVLLSTPSVVSWSKDRQDLFSIGRDLGLFQMYADGEDDLGPWYPLGGKWSTYAPTVVSREKNTLDILLVGLDDRALYIKSWDGSSWSSFTRVGGYCTSRPAAVSRSSKRIDVVVRGGDGGLWHNSYDADTKAWSKWTSISNGTQVQAEPDAVSWGSSRLDIFALGTDGSLLHKSFDGKTWTPRSGFETLGTGLSGPPKAVSDAANSLHVFAYARKGNVVHLHWNETTKEWLPKGEFHDLGTP